MKKMRTREEELRKILLPEDRRRVGFFGAKNLEGKGGRRMAMPSGYGGEGTSGKSRAKKKRGMAEMRRKVGGILRNRMKEMVKV